MKRLDLALIHLHPELSRRRARDVIEKGQVLVNGAVVRDAGRFVLESASLSWDPNRRALPRARIALPVLYADESLLIIDKPAGLLSVPTSPQARREDTALARVQDYARHMGGGRTYVGRVHRLDRDTSGALAFALTPIAREALLELFKAHRIERRYLAIVDGRPDRAAGIVKAPVAEAYKAGRRRVARPDEPALPAVTHWKVLERLSRAALVEVSLETGRQHQIRVHLAHIGLPIVGDTVYGRPCDRPPFADRPMLHARLLGFRHPLTGAPVRVESPLPPDFRKILTAFRRQARRNSPPSNR